MNEIMAIQDSLERLGLLDGFNHEDVAILVSRKTEQAIIRAHETYVYTSHPAFSTLDDKRLFGFPLIVSYIKEAFCIAYIKCRATEEGGAA